MSAEHPSLVGQGAVRASMIGFHGSVTATPCTQRGFITSMRIKASLIIFLLLRSVDSSAAQAPDERCKAPPYGASMEAYNVFVAETGPSDRADNPSAGKHPLGAMDL